MERKVEKRGSRLRGIRRRATLISRNKNSPPIVRCDGMGNTTRIRIRREERREGGVALNLGDVANEDDVGCWPKKSRSLGQIGICGGATT